MEAVKIVSRFIDFASRRAELMRVTPSENSTAVSRLLRVSLPICILLSNQVTEPMLSRNEKWQFCTMVLPLA